MYPDQNYPDQPQPLRQPIGRPWSWRDDADLTLEHDRGRTVDDIARLLNRSPAAVRCRWRALAFDLDSFRGGPPRRAYAPWSGNADWRLLVESQNATVYELAEEFGRSPSAIRSRLRHIRKMRNNNVNIDTRSR